jgi:hypothetical protein
VCSRRELLIADRGGIAQRAQVSKETRLIVAWSG